MSVGPFSRYRSLAVLNVTHARRGRTRSLPIRRPAAPAALSIKRLHRYSGFESADLLALKYFGREELFWHLLDANEGRLPDSFEPGEMLAIPPLDQATRVER